LAVDCRWKRGRGEGGASAVRIDKTILQDEARIAAVARRHQLEIRQAHPSGDN
jgi:hypothetical protein